MSETKQNIFISKNCPLIVSGTDSCREYNYVVLEKGAFIRILDGSKFSIETLTREFPVPKVPVSNAGKQTFAQDEIYNGFDIIIAGKDGENGKNGGNGGSGNEGGSGGGGGRGKDGLPVNQNFDFTVKNLGFDLNIYYGGGKGGDGGNGGNSSGEGLLGGYGGDGGMGGDGGDQSDFTLTVTCSSTSEQAYICKVTNAVSIGGKGGQGGIGGSPVPTSGNNNGSRGTDGSKGGKGRVILNGKEVG